MITVTRMVFWSKVRQVSTCEDEPQVIVVKTEFERPGQTVPVFHRTRRSADDGNENIALDRGIPQPGISQAKKKILSIYVAMVRFHVYIDICLHNYHKIINN